MSRNRKKRIPPQFDVSDNRTLDEVVRWLIGMDYIPSFCTACYREGRTGDRFMSLCKNQQILNCCHPNALMTLQEYLEDYASPETKAAGEGADPPGDPQSAQRENPGDSGGESGEDPKRNERFQILIRITGGIAVHGAAAQ